MKNKKAPDWVPFDRGDYWFGVARILFIILGGVFGGLIGGIIMLFCK